jgi:hypothetical protein
VLLKVVIELLRRFDCSIKEDFMETVYLIAVQYCWDFERVILPFDLLVDEQWQNDGRKPL